MISEKASHFRVIGFKRCCTLYINTKRNGCSDLLGTCELQPKITLNPDQISYGIETYLSHCEQLWRALSDNQLLTDLWEYRLCFHQSFSKHPYLIYASVEDRPIALLPLEYLKIS